MKLPFTGFLEKGPAIARNIGEAILFGAIAGLIINLFATGIDAIGDYAEDGKVSAASMWQDFYNNPWLSPEGVVNGTANSDLVKFLILAIVAEAYRKS